MTLTPCGEGTPIAPVIAGIGGILAIVEARRWDGHSTPSRPPS